jgi:hypothetical protein
MFSFGLLLFVLKWGKYIKRQPFRIAPFSVSTMLNCVVPVVIVKSINETFSGGQKYCALAATAFPTVENPLIYPEVSAVYPLTWYVLPERPTKINE